MKLDEVRTCLEADGWPVEPLSEVTLRSRFRASSRIFPLFIHLEPPFITLAVIPFVKVPTDPDAGDVLMRRLLQLNREINMAKFSVDDDGDVVLSVEYKLADLDPSEVRDAVDVLSFYADRHHGEVAQLAQDEG